MIDGEVDLNAKLKGLLDIDAHMDELKEELKRLNEKYDELNWELTQYFQVTGTEGKKIYDKNFVLTSRTFVKLEDQAAFEEWVEKNNAYKLVFARNNAKIQSYCDECLQNGEEIPNGVTPGFIKHYIQIRKG
jgi:hypothetical protein